MKLIFLLFISILSINLYACQMSRAALVKATAIESIKTLNGVDEVYKNLYVDFLSSRMVFTRELLGSILCVERNLSFNIGPDCQYTVENKEETFIKAENCSDYY